VQRLVRVADAPVALGGVAGLGHELEELLVGHLVLVEPERLEIHLVRRRTGLGDRVLEGAADDALAGRHEHHLVVVDHRLGGFRRRRFRRRLRLRAAARGQE